MMETENKNTIRTCSFAGCGKKYKAPTNVKRHEAAYCWCPEHASQASQDAPQSEEETKTVQDPSQDEKAAEEASEKPKRKYAKRRRVKKSTKGKVSE